MAESVGRGPLGSCWCDRSHVADGNTPALMARLEGYVELAEYLDVVANSCKLGAARPTIRDRVSESDSVTEGD